MKLAMLLLDAFIVWWAMSLMIMSYEPTDEENNVPYVMRGVALGILVLFAVLTYFVVL